MTQYSLALIGYGNVGRAFTRLLTRKSSELRDRYGIEWRVTGIATGRRGMAFDTDGIDVARAEKVIAGGGRLDEFNRAKPLPDIPAFIRTCGADVLFEISSLNPETGEPALSYIREALNAGMHVVTPNKGPIVHGYHELRALAESKGVKLRFESTVMGGTPIFSLFRETLPAANLSSFRGILNSTTNLILSMMGEGTSFDDAVKYAQSIGLAETDPSADVDGWDAAVKLTALAIVLMDYPLKVGEVERVGIRGLTVEQVQKAKAEGRPYKLVCSVERVGAGLAPAQLAPAQLAPAQLAPAQLAPAQLAPAQPAPAQSASPLRASVRPEQVDADDPLAGVKGKQSIVQFRMDVFEELTIIESGAGPDQTAYGLLADFVGIVKS